MASIATPERAPGASAGALAAAFARWRRRAPRAALFMVALCTGIAALLWSFERGSFPTKLTYSFAIGFVCWTVHEATRLLQAATVDGWRLWHGQPRDAAGFAAGWRGIAPAVLVTVIVGPLVGIALADAITGNRSPSLLHWGATQTRVTIALTLIGSLASVFALGTLERLASARALAESAQRQAAEHQLRLLQSQLEPHMLFNTLANLRVLIGLDPPRAQAMLDRLIGFLRSTLAASRAGTHSLGDEFARLDDYLALMTVRMGPRLSVTLTLPGDLAAWPVPALLLQPLVENSIRHGLEPKVDGGRVEVSAARDGPMLVLTVRDTGVGLPAAPREGFGVAQVRERLATRYGARARFELVAAPDGGTLARLELPSEAA